MAKVKDPAWVKELSDLAQNALWKDKHDPTIIRLRNLFKRRKGFHNIDFWEINYGSMYDEWGISAASGERVVGIKFRKGKKEWTFP